MKTVIENKYVRVNRRSIAAYLVFRGLPLISFTYYDKSEEYVFDNSNRTYEQFIVDWENSESRKFDAEVRHLTDKRKECLGR